MKKYRFMKGTCKFCGRRLRYANIPNRGSVMAHANGDGERCRRLRDQGRDMVSYKEKVDAERRR